MSDQDLTARIIQLEAAVAELRATLEQPAPGRSMQQSARCPGCGAGRLLHFRHVQDLTHNAVVPFSLQKLHSVWSGLKLNAGILEAFACRACKLVEWHAISLDDVQVDGTEVVAIEPGPDAPPAAPYR